MSIYDCQIVYPDSSMRLVEVRIMWYRRRSLHHCGDGGMDFYVSLGARLKAFRVRAGLSQADLGARLGRSASAINRYETGQRRLPAEDLIRLAELLGVSPEDLLGVPSRSSGRRHTGPSGLSPEELRVLRALGRKLSYTLPGPEADRVHEGRAAYVPGPLGIRPYVRALTPHRLGGLRRSRRPPPLRRPHPARLCPLLKAGTPPGSVESSRAPPRASVRPAAEHRMEGALV